MNMSEAVDYLERKSPDESSMLGEAIGIVLAAVPCLIKQIDEQAATINAMLQAAANIKAKLHALRDLVWDKDIPSPTCPEYREHHEDIQCILRRIDAILQATACPRCGAAATIELGDGRTLIAAHCDACGLYFGVTTEGGENS